MKRSGKGQGLGVTAAQPCECAQSVPLKTLSLTVHEGYFLVKEKLAEGGGVKKEKSVVSVTADSPAGGPQLLCDCGTPASSLHPCGGPLGPGILNKVYSCA